MNIIFAKHGDSRSFCFAVPDELSPYLKKDMRVLVETKLGLDVATTTTGVICGEGATDTALMNGAYLPLKNVISFFDERLYRTEVHKIFNKVKDVFFPQTDMPF